MKTKKLSRTDGCCMAQAR